MNRKIILLFVFTIAAATAVFIFLNPAAPSSKLTSEEKAARQKEQQIFAEWYEDYVFNLEQLDFNWRQYHRILNDFREEIIDADTAAVRLAELHDKQQDRLTAIKKHVPPTELRSEIYDLTAAVYKKQYDFAAGQAATITKSTSFLDNDGTENLSDEEVIRKLDEITITNSPPALFTAEEISAIRDYLVQADEN